MSLSMISLRRQLREHCGLIGNDESEIPDQDTDEKTGCDTYLNRAYWEILDKYKFREKEVIASFVTIASTPFYHVPTLLEALQSLAIKDNNSDAYTPLDPMTSDEYNQVFVNTTDNEGKPEKYLRETSGIRLWPTPDDVYTLKIRYWSVLSDLSDTVDPTIPQVWHEVILFGGVARALMGTSRDNLGAQVARNWQAALINGITPVDEKEKADIHRAGLEVLGLEGDL